MKFNRSFFLILICGMFFTMVLESQNLEKLSNDQFQFTEGPVWDGIGNLYFSDVQAKITYKYELSSSTFSEAITNSNGGNGMMFNENEDLIICEGDAKRLQRRSINGDELETLATTYNNLAFNKPNDLCIDKSGGVYFTDPTWGNQTQGNNRLYYRKPNGEIIALLEYGNNKPNGVIISPGGEYLYINDSWSTTIKRYDIDVNGNISNGIDFATLGNPDNDNISGADGMAVDANGNLYVTGKIGVQVFNTAGTTINTISIPEKATNCTFGGENKDILFVTAQRNLYQLQLPGVMGIRHPFDLPENPLSVNEFSLAKSLIKLYPNPVIADSFFIDFKKRYVVESIFITDHLGKQIKIVSFSNQGNKVHVKLNSALSSGMYHITINTTKGRVANKLFVK